MTWTLTPATSSGPLRIGATRAEVRNHLGQPEHVIEAEMPGDYYPGVHVTYDSTERCVVIEVWSQVAPMLEGIELLTLPYINMVRRLRLLDPLLLVDSGGAMSLPRGIGVSAPDGIDAPQSPAATAIVFDPGIYGDVFSRRTPPKRIAVRDLSFAQLDQRLSEAGWSSTVIDKFAPLVAGEPETAEFRRGADQVLTHFNPVVELRSLELDRCSPEAARELTMSVSRWAAVDSAAALVDPVGLPEILWGLTVAEVLADRQLLEIVKQYHRDPHALITDAAHRATAAIESDG